MNPTLADPVAAVLVLRTIAPQERHALIFSRFDALASGQSLQVLSDHNPQPLRYQFDDRSCGQFEWSTLEAGPVVWRVQITHMGKPAVAAAGDACCSGGACCG